jgi:hypothetical protein
MCGKVGLIRASGTGQNQCKKNVFVRIFAILLQGVAEALVARRSVGSDFQEITLHIVLNG